MLITQNLRNYPRISLLLIVTLVLTFTMVTSLLTSLENNQQSFIEKEIDKIPFHFSIEVYDVLHPNNSIDLTIMQHPAVNQVLVREKNSFYAITGQKQNPSDLSQNYSDMALNFMFIKFYCTTNTSFLELRSNLGLNHSKQLSGNEAIINTYAAQKWNVTIGEQFYLIQTTENRSVIRNYTVVDIIKGSYFETTTDWLNFESGVWKAPTEVSNYPMILVSPAQMRETKKSFVSRSSDRYSINVELIDSVIDSLDLRGSVTRIRSFSESVLAQVQINGEFQYRPHAIWELNDLIMSVQTIYFWNILLLIPSFALVGILLINLIQFWVTSRKSELDVLYRRGMDQQSIIRLIRKEIIQFALLSLVIHLFLIIIVYSILNFNLTQLIPLTLIVDLSLLTILWIFTKSRLINPSFEKTDLKLSVSLHKRHYIIIGLGIIPVGVGIINSLALTNIGILLSIQILFEPLITPILILGPLFGLYGFGLLLFLLFRRLSLILLQKRSIPYVFQDLIRNDKQIFQIFLVLSLGLTLSLGPVLANDMITDHDQRQLQAYFGASYTTGFVSTIGNYTVIKENLDKIDDLGWAAILSLDGTIALSSGPSSGAKIYLISEDYFKVLMPDQQTKIPKSIRTEFESNTNIGFIQKDSLQSDFLKNKKFIESFIIEAYDYSDLEESNPKMMVHYGGSIDYLPGGYIGPSGYLPPFGQEWMYYNPVQHDIVVFARFTPSFESIIGVSEMNTPINFLFDLSNSTDHHETVESVQNIIGVPIQQFSSSTIGDTLLGVTMNTIARSCVLLGVFNGLFLVIFLNISFNGYLLQRKEEFGIFRAKGMDKRKILQIMIIELLIIIFGGVLWSFFHTLIYAAAIARIAVLNDMFQLRFIIGFNSFILLLVITIGLVVIGVIRPIILSRQNITHLLQRRL